MGLASQRQAQSSPRTTKWRPSLKSRTEFALVGLVSRQRPSDPAAAGHLTIPLTPAVLAKFGKTTWQVFDALLQLRSSGGEMYASLAGIARRASDPVEETNFWPRKKITERQVRRALTKLGTLGLVENLGWTYRDVPCKDRNCWNSSMHFHEIFLRHVKGLVIVKPETPDLFQLLAPKETVDALKKAKAHGGERRGRGPDKKPRQARHRWVDPLIGMTVEEHQKYPFVGVPVESLSKEELEVVKKICAPPPPKLKVVSRTPAVEVKPTPPPAEAPVKLAPAAAAPKSGTHFPNIDPSVGGLRLGGGSQGLASLVVHAPRKEDQWTPPFPGPSYISSPRVPEPPQLDEALGPEQRARELLRAYRTVLEVRTGVRPQAFAHVANIARLRAFKPLVECAALLLDHGIAPMAWVSWSLNVWREFAKSNQSPSVRWVLNPQRVEKWHGWFHAEEVGYRGGQTISLPAARELYVRWERMQVAIRKGATQQEAIELHLSKETFERLVAEARTQAARIQLDLNRQVTAGKFIWT